MKKFIAWLFFLFTYNASADLCDIGMPDLKEVIESVNKANVLVIAGLTDPNSEEPIRRYVQALSDGSIMLIEQKHCTMYNFTITLLLPDAVSDSVASQRLGDMLEKMPVWSKWFNKKNPNDILKAEFNATRFKTHQDEAQSFSYALDDKIFAETEGSEVVLSYAHLDSNQLPFSSVFSIYIGVGGI
ncbi:MAG: hypothetical protein P8179_19780 [Candidatus Thiodiazotropha sp.]|jgi:hypothetical protein